MACILHITFPMISGGAFTGLHHTPLRLSRNFTRWSNHQNKTSATFGRDHGLALLYQYEKHPQTTHTVFSRGIRYKTRKPVDQESAERIRSELKREKDEERHLRYLLDNLKAEKRFQATTNRVIANWKPDTQLNQEISPPFASYLKKVYQLLGESLGLCGLSMATAHLTGFSTALLGLGVPAYLCVMGVPLIGGAAYIVTRPYTMQHKKERMLALYSIATGVLLSPLAFLGAKTLGVAFVLSSLTFIGMSYLSTKIHRMSTLHLATPLAVCTTTLVTAGLAGALLPNTPITEALSNINLYGGLLVFSVYMVFNHHMMHERFIHGDVDYVNEVLTFFWDYMNLFVRFAHLLKESTKH